MLYDEYVGLHLKVKIDQMKTWENTLKIPPRKKEEKET